MRKIFLVPIILLLLALIAWATYDWYLFARAPLMPEGVKTETTIIVEPGTSLTQLSLHLAEAHYITHPRLFTVYARLHGYTRTLQSGEYVITPKTSIKILLSHIINGVQLVRKQTVIEGWTFAQLRQALAENPHLAHKIDNWNDEQIMSALGSVRAEPEGEFFPATYAYTYGMSDLDLLKKANDKMSNVLAAQWQARSNNTPFQRPYDALIVASLIEKETAIDVERAEIAGVIINRLEKNMRLQIDPTVYYAVNKTYSDPLTKTDLKTDSPYNTYMVKGLPPTPICLPGLASIKAALNPAETMNLYYVANGEGGHYFSRTYRQHQAAIKKLL